jgi:molybdate-binding protein
MKELKLQKFFFQKRCLEHILSENNLINQKIFGYQSNSLNKKSYFQTIESEKVNFNLPIFN